MNFGSDNATVGAPRLLYLGADIDHCRRGEREIVALTHTRIICRTREAERKVAKALLASNERLVNRASGDPMTGKFDYGTALRYDLDGQVSVIDMTLVWYTKDFYPVGSRMVTNPAHRRIFEGAGIAIEDITSVSFVRASPLGGE